jgi:hypothetical protein
MKGFCSSKLPAIFAPLLLVPSLLVADTLTVPGTHATIVDAVTAAQPGDIIEVSAGTYTEAAAPNFTNNDVTLRAIGGQVVINSPSSAEAAVFISADNIVIEGVKVQRLTADSDWRRSIQVNTNRSLTLVDCAIEGPGNGVGVILFNGADLSASGTTFQNFNTAASWAGAIFMEGGGGGFTNLSVDDCTFGANCNGWIRTFSGNLPRVGNVSVKNSTFNATPHPHGLVFNNGTAYEPGSTLLFEDNVFTGTRLEVAEFHYTGAGAPASLTFRRCIFKPWTSNRRGMYLDLPCPITFENVIWEGGQFESLLRFWGGPADVTFNNCTLVNDGVTSATSSSGINSSTLVDGWDGGGRTFTFRNCLLYSPTNYSAALFGDWSSNDNRNYDVDYSIMQHLTPLDGLATLNAGSNYSEQDILFVNAAARDFELQESSPAVDTGTDLGLTLDVLRRPRPNGSGPDMGALELQSGVVVQVRDSWAVY